MGVSVHSLVQTEYNGTDLGNETEMKVTTLSFCFIVQERSKVSLTCSITNSGFFQIKTKDLKVSPSSVVVLKFSITQIASIGVPGSNFDRMRNQLLKLFSLRPSDFYLLLYHLLERRSICFCLLCCIPLLNFIQER